MWPTVLTSALLGAGVALVTSEPHGQSHFSAVAPPQQSLPGVTCQMRPDLRLISPAPCRGGAATQEPCAYHGFVSLSADLSSCALIGADALADGLQFKTPYCNDTQMTACAEATGSFWKQHGSDDFPKVPEAPAASIIQVLVAPLVNLKLGADLGYQEMLLAPVAPRTNIEEHQPSTASPREAPQTAPNYEPLQDDAIVNHQPAVEVTMDTKGGGVQAPSPQAIKFIASSSEKPGISKPTGSGNKQLAGMAAALATVLLIFVVWL